MPPHGWLFPAAPARTRSPAHIKAQLLRELSRLELLIEQIKAVEVERDAILAQDKAAMTNPTVMLLGIKGDRAGIRHRHPYRMLVPAFR
jgi:transposase